MKKKFGNSPNASPQSPNSLGNQRIRMNSPKTPISSNPPFRYLPHFKERYKLLNGSPESIRKRFEGLEAIGLFSGFANSKYVLGYNSAKNFRKQRTIHVTDFMKKVKKTQMLLTTGGWDMHLEKKQEDSRENFKREIEIKRFLNHSENIQKFTMSLPASPMSHSLVPLYNSKTRIEPVSQLDLIIEKCEQALLKPKRKLKIDQIKYCAGSPD